MPAKKIYLLPTILLKRAWVSNMNKWLRYRPILSENDGYTTESRSIKVNELLNAICKEMTQRFIMIKQNIEEVKTVEQIDTIQTSEKHSIEDTNKK